MNLTIATLQAQHDSFPEGSLQRGVAQKLMEYSREYPAFVTVLNATEKTIGGCVEFLTEKVKKKAKQGDYYMDDREKLVLIAEFYTVDIESKPKQMAQAIDISNLL